MVCRARSSLTCAVTPGKNHICFRLNGNIIEAQKPRQEKYAAEHPRSGAHQISDQNMQVVHEHVIRLRSECNTLSHRRRIKTLKRAGPEQGNATSEGTCKKALRPLCNAAVFSIFEQGCHATSGRRPGSRFHTSIHHGASPIADRCLDGNVGCLEACAIEFPPLLPRW